MKKATKVTLLVLIAIGVGVGTAYAASWSYTVPPSAAGIKLYGDWYNQLYIGSDGNTEHDDENFYYLDEDYIGLASENGGQARGSFVIHRTGNNTATAKMEGSGGGSVLCDLDGDVIVTLGN